MSVVELSPEREVLTQTQRDLRAAEAYMREHGWCQRHKWDDEGRVCVSGAIWFSVGLPDVLLSFDDPRFARWERCLDALQVTLGQDPRNWNDIVCRREAQALAALREASR